MRGLKLFYSYCHADEQYRLQLEKWLTTVRKDGLISEWHDRKLSGGQPLQTEIARHLAEADVVLLLLSQDFIASAACTAEMDYALARSTYKRVIPVILKRCAWQDTPCGSLLALPRDGKPIDSWSSPEEAWFDVFAGIKVAIDDIRQNAIVREDFVAELQQVEFVSQRKRKVRLNDIFVYPVITRYGDDEAPEVLDSSFFVTPGRQVVVITGDELSGKSALLATIHSLLRESDPPVFLDGRSIFKSADFESLLRREFARQMIGDFDRWVVRRDKSILIDNFHHRISEKVVGYLRETFQKTILTMDADEYLVHFRDDPTFAHFESVSIRPLTLAKQEALIRKWASLQEDGAEADQPNDLAIDKIEEKVNTVISGNRILPRYPFYVLTVLQSLEGFMPADYAITAYGHCYQALITAQLIRKNVKSIDIDSSFNYLAELAHYIHRQGSGGGKLKLTGYAEFKEEYRAKYLILDATVRRIEDEDYPVIRFREESMSFEYPYAYYFFLGKYMASKGTEAEIDTLCSAIHLRENAFILIFTVHHAQARGLLETILVHCVCSFDKHPPATLEPEETRFMEGLLADLPKSIISAGTVTENRQDQRAREVSEDQEEYVENTELREIAKALKIIDVLGQILKNRSGSFERSTVLETLENTIDLGLRILSSFLSDFQKPEFAAWLQGRLRESRGAPALGHGSHDGQAERLRFVERTIQVSAHFVTIAMLSKISFSIRSERLVDGVIRLSAERDTAAYKLVGYTVALSQRGMDFREFRDLFLEFQRTKNHWAARTLSFYVQGFLNTHRVNYRDRQRVFQLLDLPYVPNR